MTLELRDVDGAPQEECWWLENADTGADLWVRTLGVRDTTAVGTVVQQKGGTGPVRPRMNWMGTAFT